MSAPIMVDYFRDPRRLGARCGSRSSPIRMSLVCSKARLRDEIPPAAFAKLVPGALGAESGNGAFCLFPMPASALASPRRPSDCHRRQVPSEVVPVSFGLDDVARGLAGVGFIKIDVEGHEARGAPAAPWATITESRPTLLIEIEERHRKGAALRGGLRFA